MDPVGACCATVSPWACTETSEYNCSTIGSGVYQGDGSTCTPIDAAGGCPVQLTPFVDPLPIPLPGTPASSLAGGPPAKSTYPPYLWMRRLSSGAGFDPTRSIAIKITVE